MKYKRIIIITPNSMRVSARKLQQELKTVLPTFIIKPKSSTYQGRLSDYVIIWGLSKQTEYLHTKQNYWQQIHLAVQKQETLIALKENNIPTIEFTLDKQTAQAWLAKGNTVVCRTTVNGYGGEGILLVSPENAEDFVECPLYTKYKKKKHEYRVHVMYNEVIDITQKKKKIGVPINTKVRNYKNGWVYCRSDIHYNNDLRSIALGAIKALKLDFGAVDIIWNEKEDKYYVLEVNTAAGLVGTTLNAYVTALTKDILS